MTTEEKAKAHDMALEAARKELGVDRKEWEVVQRVLHNIFPELRESEDERIRKWLIELVKNTDTNHSNIKLSENCKLALAYLEKQKEQKPNIEICPHSTKSKSYKETGYPSVTRFVYNKSDEEFIRDCANILKANDYEPSAERLLSMIEQKAISQEDFDKAKHEALWKEQKPAEWSEESDMNQTLKLLEAIAEDNENDYCPYNADTLRKTISWLKSLRPQPKQEWSKEDENKGESIRM